MNNENEIAIYCNPLIYDKEGKEISCCKFGAKISAKYYKLFEKLDGKTVKMVCRINVADKNKETDLEGFTLQAPKSK